MAARGSNDPGAPKRVGTVDHHGLLDMASIENLPMGVYELRSCNGGTVCLGFGDEGLIDPKHSILTRPPTCCDRDGEVGAVCMGLVTGPNYVCGKCACNLHNALCNRHGKLQPPFTGEFTQARARIESSLQEIRLLYEDLLVHYQEHWIEKWPKAKQEDIRRSVMLDPEMPERVGMFVKREGGQNMPTKARGIQPYMNLATQSRYGPEFTALQKACTSVWDGRFIDGISITFASGMNSKQLGEWMDEVYRRCAKPIFYERDGKNWDACMQAGHQDLENMIYEVAGPEFFDFVNRGFDVKGMGKTRHGVLRYRLRGTRKSGHNNTSLGNSIVNAMIAYEAMWRMGLTGRIIVVGDDLLVACFSDFDADEFANIERQFGIIPEYRKFTSWSDVSFISGIWLPGPNGFFFAPKPGRLLKRLFWTTKTVARKKVKDWRHSVVAGLSPTLAGVPVIASWLKKNDTGGKIIDTGKDLSRWQSEVEADRTQLLYYFAARYGVSVLDLINVEKFIMDVPIERGLVTHPVLERMAEVDNADIDIRPVCCY
jgi:hypothetical protein